MKTNGLILIAPILFLVTALLLFVQAEAAAQTTTAVVSNGNDSGAGSLRDAIAALGGAGGIVTFTPEMHLQIVTLASEIEIAAPITVTAETLDITISGENVTRVFAVSQQGALTLQNLFIANGFSVGTGGGAISNAGMLVVTASKFISNSVSGNFGSSGGSGGAISNARDGSLFITSSLFSDNESSNQAGGAIFNAGSAEISNTILSTNSAQVGGAIFNTGGATIDLVDVTLESNSATEFGGGLSSSGTATISGGFVRNNTSSSTGGGVELSGRTTISGTEIADNEAPSGAGIQVERGIVDLINIHLLNNLATSTSLGGGGLSIRGGTLTLTGGIVQTNEAVNAGGGILNENSTPLTIDGTLIHSNKAAIGGGVYVAANATLNLSASSINGNTAVDGSGLFNLGETLVEESTVNVNFATGDGGGLMNSDAGQLTLRNSSILENEASGNGGGIYVDTNATLTMTGGVVQGNEADDAGGGIITLSSQLMIDGTLIRDNEAATGGGIASESGALNLVNATVELNIATTGGGLHLSHQTLATVTSSTIQTNTANADGGGLFNLGQTTVADTTVANNIASRDGAGMLNSDGGQLTVRNSNILDNEASRRGGGVYVDTTATLTVTNSALSDNAAVDGSGLFNFGNTTIVDTTVANNVATSEGGGLMNSNGGRLTLHSSTLTGNQAPRGGGIRDVANNAPGRFVAVENSTISGNSATEFGSAIVTDGEMAIVNSTIASNTSSGQANAVRVGVGAVVTMTNNIIASNDNADCFLNPGLLTIRHSIIADGSCGVTDGVDGNVVAEPLLATLANNGGPLTAAGTAPPTHLLLDQSPAIDAADNTSCPLHDQRDFARDDGACDMGAVEESCVDVSVVINGNDDGAGSLRQAINGVCTGGTVSFAQDMTVTLATQIAIKRRVTVGADNQEVTISGDGVTRIFDIRPTAVVTLSRLAFANGVEAASSGGAIFNRGRLVVVSSHFTNNAASLGAGGAISNLTSATLAVTDSSFVNNRSNNGGAIFNLGSAEISNTLIMSNTADVGGGLSSGASSGHLTMVNSVIDGNTALVEGGGLKLIGSSTLHNVQISNNHAVLNGGGVFIAEAGFGRGQLASLNLMTDCTVANNTARFGGGIATQDAIKLTVRNCAIVGNSASTHGGGIHNQADVTLINSTLSGNSANGGLGGAFHNRATMAVLFSTISDNIVRNMFDNVQLGAVNNAGTLTLGNSIIANSDSDLGGGDCTSGGTLIDGGYNLIEDANAACALTVDSNDNIIGQDPALAPLAENGGATETHALLPNSPAIGIADQTVCEADPIFGLDQRGFARDATCDIGAFEVDGVPTSVALIQLNATTEASSAVWLLALLLGAATLGCGLSFGWRDFGRKTDTP